jgi:hypothetical protein
MLLLDGIDCYPRQFEYRLDQSHRIRHREEQQNRGNGCWNVQILDVEVVVVLEIKGTNVWQSNGELSHNRRQHQLTRELCEECIEALHELDLSLAPTLVDGVPCNS